MARKVLQGGALIAARLAFALAQGGALYLCVLFNKWFNLTALPSWAWRPACYSTSTWSR